ncbi:MAG TPA: tetraacyldisaccharide 4'-kinase [Xanthobacteraceae bacterium]|nr:tetraacyldisaccharide 4'-kinase [Xanthobacteraceae bacterium]
MRAPAFWWRKAGVAAALLSPLGAIYGAIAAALLAHAGKRAALPVICIGDPTLGGGGKTPAAIAVAALLREIGERPTFLTRGYGGRERGPLVVDPAIHDAAAVGDEPLLLARVAPTVVAADRIAGALLATGTDASVIVMDDGFQSPALEKDLSLLVIDAAVGLGNGFVFPAGPLRAPWPAQVQRAQALVVVGDNLPSANPLPAFQAKLVADESAAAALKGKRLLAFAGIGRPDKFFATLRALGAEVAVARRFPDHHPYSPNDARILIADANANDLVLVTTEKDRVRFGRDLALIALAEKTQVLPVTLKFAKEPAVKQMIAEALLRRQRARAG